LTAGAQLFSCDGGARAPPGKRSGLRKENNEVTPDQQAVELAVSVVASLRQAKGLFVRDLLPLDNQAVGVVIVLLVRPDQPVKPLPLFISPEAADVFGAVVNGGESPPPFPKRDQTHRVARCGFGSEEQNHDWWEVWHSSNPQFEIDTHEPVDRWRHLQMLSPHNAQFLQHRFPDKFKPVNYSGCEKAIDSALRERSGTAKGGVFAGFE